MLRVSFYDTKPYDREFFEEATGHETPDRRFLAFRCDAEIADAARGALVETAVPAIAQFQELINGRLRLEEMEKQFIHRQSSSDCNGSLCPGSGRREFTAQMEFANLSGKSQNVDESYANED